VYFGLCDDRNVSEPLGGEKPTNQRAELTAVLRAVVPPPSTFKALTSKELVDVDVPLVIVTDSMYCINSIRGEGEGGRGGMEGAQFS
jgi:ribonuclease HI